VTFADKLKQLMAIFRISSIALARGVSVDPSLVSRWRSGERVPAGASSYDELGAFLAGRPMLPHDRAALVQTLSCPCATLEETAAAVSRYLSGVSAAPPPEPHAALLPELRDALDNFFGNRPVLHSEPVNLWPQVQRGAPADHETFRGNQGKRQACVNFFHATMSCPRPLDVFLCTDGDNRWITESDAFALLWERCLHTLCRQGHTIHRVHMGRMSAPALLLSLQADASLFATGRYSALCCPQMSDPLRTAFFVSGGFAALQSHTLTEGETSTVLYKNPGDTELFARQMLAYIDGGTLLAQAVSRASPLALGEMLCKLDDRPGRAFGYSLCPGGLFLPEDSLYALLSKHLTAQQVDRRLDVLARRREILLQGRDYAVEVWPESVLDAILINESCRIGGAELALPRDEALSGAELLHMLRHARQFLLDCPHLTLIFDAEPPPDAALRLKENHGCFFVPDWADATSSALFTAHPDLLNSLGGWFEDVLKRHDRREGVERLNKVIAELEAG
jgi:hypothetical protein